jgi:hypothetical protein
MINLLIVCNFVFGKKCLQHLRHRPSRRKFEAGPRKLGKGGILRDPDAR